MRTQLTLTAPLLATNGNQRGAVAAEIRNSTAELEGDIKLNMRRSLAAGRTYRRGPILRKDTRATAGLKLAKRGDRNIVGFNFHRASKRGQPPAIDTGILINSIRGMAVSETVGRINVGAAYGVPLDDPEGLDRPFFTVRVNLYRPRFLERIRRAFLGR